MYASFDYYKGSYLGTLIPEQDYPRVALRAEQYLDYYTMCKSRENAELDAVKMAACALAEKYYEMERLKDVSEKQSESVGSYSVTYRPAYLASEDAKRIQQELPAVVRMYLSGTGLLYRGRC